MSSALHRNNLRKEPVITEREDNRCTVVMFAAVLLITLHLSACFFTSSLRSATATTRLQIAPSGALFLSHKKSFSAVVFTRETLKNVYFFFKPVPINFSDREMLTSIRGIGPSLAENIIRVREEEGIFNVPEDLLKVPGIGVARMDAFAPKFSFVDSLENI